MTCRYPFWNAGLLFAGALALFLARPAAESLAADVYDKQDLGTLGGKGSVALAVDELGEVVGLSNIPDGDAHACLFDGIQDLGTLAGGKTSGAVAINDTGWILGYSQAGDGKSHIVAWHAKGDGTDALAARGTRLALDLGPGNVAALNARGDILGTKENASRSFLYTDGTFTDLGSLGGPFTGADQLNAFRQIVGSSQTQAGKFHGFLWQNGVMADLTGQSGTTGATFFINNLTEVVGLLGSFGQARLMLWRSGQPPIDLTSAAKPYPVKFVTAINDGGEIALSTGSGASDVTVILGPALQVEAVVPTNFVSGMNNAGQLVYTSPEGRAILLTPTGGKLLTGPETDQALGQIRSLKAEFSSAGQTAPGPAQIALLNLIVPDLGAAEHHLAKGFTRGAVGELKAILRIIAADVPPATGGTPERINRVKELITRLGGSLDV